MVVCPHCGNAHRDTDVRCSRCGFSLVGISKADNDATIQRWREKRRLRGNMITGALLCFGLPTLLGLPLSLLPLELLQNLVFAVIFGVPLGWSVAKFAHSVIGGAAIGCGIGIVYATIALLLQGAPPTLANVLAGVAIGLIPGAIMGWHVETEA